MQILHIGEQDYKIKFGYNCFCDTDLMDRVQQIAKLFNENGVEDDAGVSGLGKIKDLFCVVRDLLFTGFQKLNPVETLQEVGELLDTYNDEAPEGEKRGLMELFGILSAELMEEGFLADLLTAKGAETAKAVTKRKVPKDHLKAEN